MEASLDSKVTDSSGNPIIKAGDTLIKVTIGLDTNQEVDKVLKTEDGGKLFQTMREKSFYEYLGEYQKNSEVSTENKEVYRIITYVEK